MRPGNYNNQIQILQVYSYKIEYNKFYVFSSVLIRLTSRYLDKELAGRIQQLQLLGREIKGALRDKLWRQLEAEILIQRHKTVVRACRNQNYLIMNNTPAHPVRSEPTAAEVQVKDPSEVREIVLEIREPDELGIFITVSNIIHNINIKIF